MDSSSQKFSLPDDFEESFDDPPPSGPKYFKPGNLLKTAKDDTQPLDDTFSITDKNMETSKSSSSEPSVSFQKTAPKEPSARYLSDFGNLKESKFYDKSIESSSSEIIQAKPKNSSALFVNPRQRGNPLLKHIRNVPWEYFEVEPDYVLGKSTCALFLSLRYHNLFPNYIHDRLKALGKSYQLRILLVQVDVTEPNPPLKDLSVISILAECTLMVCWSAEEAGNYLETYKMFENKSADLIKEKQDSDHNSQLIDCLTTVRSINKTDAMVLLTTFKTLKNIIGASVEELAQCPGLGPLKAKRLYDALRKPLMNVSKR